MEQPIIDDTFTLKKGEKKGAWTFIEMPALTNVPKKRNSTLAVTGRIDAFDLGTFNIWAMKKATFMAVKADIRKAIKKEEGDSVHLVLYLAEAPMVRPDDLIACLSEEPALLKKFNALPSARRKEITNWIFSAVTDEAKVERIGKTMALLENGEPLKI